MEKYKLVNLNNCTDLMIRFRSLGSTWENVYIKKVCLLLYLIERGVYMEEMSTNQAVDLLLDKQMEVLNKFRNTISEILRLGYETDRGKAEILALISSVQYYLDEIERAIK